MQQLISSAKHRLAQTEALPFTVYTSTKEQHIFNVRINKPMLICVLDGYKQLGKRGDFDCGTGSFVFLSNKPALELRNIPGDTEYFALVIEFDHNDFDGFETRKESTDTFFQGTIDQTLQQTLQQFIDWSAFAPVEMWPLRRREILQLLYHQGYKQVCSVMEPPGLSHKIYGMMASHINDDLNAAVVSARLAMSESTLRRKLSTEGTSLQEIKDSARLNYGLHRVQVSTDPVGRIAEQCGFQSQSRFTDKFKKLFGMTPTALRKTRLSDSGE
ncbi:helix-turn-helix transcriptional regulator [Endozoicomonadaceae bacterium StTr2]